jgi:hypothetical protein
MLVAAEKYTKTDIGDGSGHLNFPSSSPFFSLDKLSFLLLIYCYSILFLGVAMLAGVVVVSLVLNVVCLKLLLFSIKRLDSKDFSMLNPGSTKKFTLTYVFLAMSVYSISLILSVFFPLSLNPMLTFSVIVFFSVDLLNAKLSNKKLFSVFWVFGLIFTIAVLVWSLISLNTINTHFITICLAIFIIFIRLPYWISFGYLSKRSPKQ